MGNCWCSFLANANLGEDLISDKDLRYVAAAVQPHDVTEHNEASFQAGFLGFDFCGARPHALTPEDNWQLNRINRDSDYIAQKQRDHVTNTPKINAESLRAAAARSDGDNRPVQGRKSQTQQKLSRIAHHTAVLNKARRGNTTLDSTEAYFNQDTLYASTEACEGKQLSTVRLMKRDWSGQYRILHHTQTRPSDAPEQQSGERFTEKLTKRAVSKIFESAAYVSACHGGFTTFLTLTFSQAQRCKIFSGYVEAAGDDGDHSPVTIDRNLANPVYNVAGPYCYIDTAANDPAATVDILDDGTVKVMNENGDIAGTYCPLFAKPEKEFTITNTAQSSIGKEISRFIDGIKKMYKRGWQGQDDNGEPFELPAIVDDFHYIWVAECPANDDGEPNPHVHMLLNWSVEPEHFAAWAARIEGIWGNGFAHLERIKHSQAAGTYIIKAVGYAAKGDNADQGLIKGNRYNIARCSRAPAWDCVASFEASNMAAIIKELGYKLEQWRKPLERRLHRINKEKDQAIAAKAIAKKTQKPQDHQNKLKAKIIKLEHQARAIRDQIKSRGVHASTKNIFCLSFDGDNAEELAFDCLLWAAGARGWSMVCTDDDDEFNTLVDNARNAARVEFADNFERFQEKRAYWQGVLNDPLMPPIHTAEEIAAAESYSMTMIEQYQQLAA